MSISAVEEILDSPSLPEILQELQNTWMAEQTRRRKFYEDITPEHKWEFINGEVIMHSPALNRHLLATKRLFGLLDAYARIHSCGIVYVEKALTVFPRNDYEPDIVFFGLTKTALLEPDTLRFPVPDLIVEVLSSSTSKRDRGIKFEDYAAHGVGEYWIVDAVAETVELHRLEGKTYPPAPAQKSGILDSRVIAGFEIPVGAVFDEAENLRVLREIFGAKN